MISEARFERGAICLSLDVLKHGKHYATDEGDRVNQLNPHDRLQSSAHHKVKSLPQELEWKCRVSSVLH